MGGEERIILGVRVRLRQHADLFTLFQKNNLTDFGVRKAHS